MLNLQSRVGEKRNAVPFVPHPQYCLSVNMSVCEYPMGTSPSLLQSMAHGQPRTPLGRLKPRIPMAEV